MIYNIYNGVYPVVEFHFGYANSRVILSMLEIGIVQVLVFENRSF